MKWLRHTAAILLVHPPKNLFPGQTLKTLTTRLVLVGGATNSFTSSKKPESVSIVKNAFTIGEKLEVPESILAAVAEVEAVKLLILMCGGACYTTFLVSIKIWTALPKPDRLGIEPNLQMEIMGCMDSMAKWSSLLMVCNCAKLLWWASTAD